MVGRDAHKGQGFYRLGRAKRIADVSWLKPETAMMSPRGHVYLQRLSRQT
jgi:hypothetical protein